VSRKFIDYVSLACMRVMILSLSTGLWLLAFLCLFGQGVPDTDAQTRITFWTTEVEKERLETQKEF